MRYYTVIMLYGHNPSPLHAEDHKKALQEHNTRLRQPLFTAVNQHVIHYSVPRRGLHKLVQAMYWVCREVLPLSKFASMVRMLAALHVKNIPTSMYAVSIVTESEMPGMHCYAWIAVYVAILTSLVPHSLQTRYGASEFALALSQWLGDGLAARCRASPALGIQIDESTSLGTHKQLLVNISYWVQNSVEIR
jgi:hypothetical protein